MTPICVTGSGISTLRLVTTVAIVFTIGARMAAVTYISAVDNMMSPNNSVHNYSLLILFLFPIIRLASGGTCFDCAHGCLDEDALEGYGLWPTKSRCAANVDFA
jgi:hypothetical protein